MRSINLIILFLLFAGKIFSQSTSVNSKNSGTKGFLIFSGGPSLPIGIFSSTDYDKSGAGYANLGYNININSGYEITKRFGIASTIFYSRFQVDKILDNNLNSIYAITPPIIYTTDHWQYIGVVVGPMLTLRIVDKLMLDFKAMAGFARVNSPSITATSNITNEVLATSEDKWTDAFAIQGGTDIRYNFASRFCAFANIDYGFMHPKWTTTGKEDFKQEMGVINFNIGLGTTF